MQYSWQNKLNDVFYRQPKRQLKSIIESNNKGKIKFTTVLAKCQTNRECEKGVNYYNTSQKPGLD